MRKGYLFGKENAFGPTWTTTQSCCTPGAREVTRSGNLCSGCAVAGTQGIGGSLPSSSGQVSFPHGEKNDPLQQALIGPLVGNLSRDARVNGHEIPLKPFVVFSSGQG